ncbi:hypothetical protein D3C71_2103740 [compost metagenome]
MGNKLKLHHKLSSKTKTKTTSNNVVHNKLLKKHSNNSQLKLQLLLKRQQAHVHG